METKDKKQLQLLQHEYQQVNENLRTYVGLRFAQMTIYLGATGLLLRVVFADPAVITPLMHSFRTICVSSIGLVLSILFFVMEERAVDYWSHFRCRATQLEKQLRYKQYPHEHPENRLISVVNELLPDMAVNTQANLGRIITATWAARLVYILSVLFWLCICCSLSVATTLDITSTQARSVNLASTPTETATLPAMPSPRASLSPTVTSAPTLTTTTVSRSAPTPVNLAQLQ